MLSVLKFAIVAILIIGVLVYGYLIVQIYFLGHLTEVRAKLEIAPNLCFGLPFSAIAAFGIVSLLEFTSAAENAKEQLKLTAFSLEFTGPAGPVTLWVLCFSAFVLAIKALAK